MRHEGATADTPASLDGFPEGRRALLVLQALKRLVELPGFCEGVEPDKRAAATIVRIGEKRKRRIQRTLMDRPSLP
jgi:hypothetical protein